jgi:hypothetical protein
MVPGLIKYSGPVECALGDVLEGKATRIDLPQLGESTLDILNGFLTYQS